MPQFLTRRHTLALAAAGALCTGAPVLAQDAGADTARPVTEMFLGDAEAPVTVIEYASFTCPHCRRFHEEVYPKLKENFIEPGHVKFVFREVYFDRYGLWAGMTARCGGEMRYFGIVDMIFDQQPEWTRESSDGEVINSLFKIGKKAGLTQDQLTECTQDMVWGKALVQEYQKNATADDVTGTPSFIINGKKHSNMSYDEMAVILEDLIPR